MNQHPGQLEPSLKADILIVTVTEVEARAVLDLFGREIGRKFERQYIGDKTYFDLGSVNEASVVMVQSEMGATGPGGALLTVDEGIRVMTPSAVIMVGIAFGLGKDKQNIGDILVSQQLLGYELQKITTDSQGNMEIIPRGDIPQASTRLLDRFRGAVLDWEGAHVTFGQVLSGEKLIDNVDFRDRLHKLAPEAIGGEMEGTGLYSAAQRRKIDWIVVKAICDWADGKKRVEKEARQKLAAESAVHFTLHTLKQGGFAKPSGSSPAFSGVINQVSHPPPRAVGTLLRTYDVHSNYVVALAWEPRGSQIASAGGDGTVKVWNADTGHTLLIYHGHPWRFERVNWPPTIYTIAWSPEGLRLVSCGDGAQVFVWNATTGQTLALYKGHAGLLPNVYTAAWSPDGAYIASACSSTGLDKSIHIWDATAGELVKRLDASYGLINFSVLTVAWSPDGTRIAAACGDKTIRIWDAYTCQRLISYQTGSQWVYHLVWSPDSKSIVTAHDDHIARVWNPQTGTCLVKYYGHSDSVRYVAWSPDGTCIATASNDKTAQLWNAKTGTRIYIYREHADWVTAVAWSPDGTRIASASNDKTVQIWQANQRF